MTIKDVLEDSKIPRNESEILLAHLLQKERTWLLAHENEKLEQSLILQYQKLVDRRESHEPIAYLTGKKDFYGRSFLVNENVLIPRPATEELIDATAAFLNHAEQKMQEADTQVVVASKRLRSDDPTTIVDVGTGSGCIAITLAHEHPSKKIIATDSSNQALEVARKNAQLHHVAIEFRGGNLLEPIYNLHEPFLLVSNPPYIPKDEHLMSDVQNYEPHQALFGGKDGADLIRKLIQQATDMPNCVGIILECRTEHAILLT